MKLIYASEDCFVGLIFGVLILAMSERWFKIPYAKTILMIVIPIYLIFIVLDILHEVMDLGRHPLFIGFSIVHNLFDIVVCIGFYALFFGFSLQFIGSYVPMLADNTILFWLGMFETISHVVWLVLSPFNT